MVGDDEKKTANARIHGHRRVKKRRVRISQLKSEVDRLSHDLEALSRFIGAQKTGFRKLLKKYKKYSKRYHNDNTNNDNENGNENDNENENNDDIDNYIDKNFLPILESNNSFTRQDFTSTILELSLLYNILRDNNAKNKINENTKSKISPDISKDLLSLFDCEFITYGTNILTFWIHPDNLTQVKINLLKYMEIVIDNNDNENSINQLSRTISSLSLNRKTSLRSLQSNTNESNKNKNKNKYNDKDDDNDDDNNGNENDDSLNYSLYLDEPNKLFSVTNGLDPGQINWINKKSIIPTNKEDSNFVLCSPVGGIRHFASALISKNLTENIINNKYDEIFKSNEYSKLSNVEKIAIDCVKTRHAIPISKVSFKRLRFSEINNNNQDSTSSSTIKPKVWAVIDDNIKFSDMDVNSLDSSINSKNKKFPYSILQIRWSSSSIKPLWISNFEKSYLIKLIPKFSLYIHIISLLKSKKLSVQPSWLKILQQNIDIKGKPPKDLKKRIRPSLSRSNSNATTITTNNYASSTDEGLYLTPRNNIKRSSSYGGSSSNTNTNSPLSSTTKINGRVPLINKQQQQQQQQQQQPQVRYWNEFDNPESDDNDDTFLIPIGEDNQSNFENGLFNEQNIDKLMKFSDKVIDFWHNILIKTGFKKSSISLRNRYRQINAFNNIDDFDDGFISEDENSTQGFNTPPRQLNYQNNIQNTRNQNTNYISYHSSKRDQLLTFLYSFTLFLSALLSSTIFGFILSSSYIDDNNDKHHQFKKKLILLPSVFIIIIIGFLFSLTLAVLSMSLFFMRSEQPPWYHQTFVIVSFSTVIISSISGMVWLLDSW